MEELSANFDELMDLSSPAFQSEGYQDLVRNITENEEGLPDLRVIDNVVYKRTGHYDGVPINEDFASKLWVPAELTEKFIEKAHCTPEAAHGGFHKTLRRVKVYYFWPNIATQVRSFVKRCYVCKETKTANTTLRPPMGNQAEVE
ncbi:uncharacterized protein LOC142230599 [Haematobia irritans]|uniref:uncharacterized protein LOC142230599 n=1 Tax=Haematobia irritans TaxID=7368 RepID=UPI003F4FDADC